MQQLNLVSTNLINHDYNQNNISIGDTVAVNVGQTYVAIIKGLRLDSKNKKIFAYLKTFNKGVPARVDVSDCKKIENNI